MFKAGSPKEYGPFVADSDTGTRQEDGVIDPTVLSGDRTSLLSKATGGISGPEVSTGAAIDESCNTAATWGQDI